jgi:nucleoside-diphosphate-sugar epimerase
MAQTSISSSEKAARSCRATITRVEIVITGGGGFIGLKLAKALHARGTIADRDGEQHGITRIALANQAFPDLPKDARLESLAGDISEQPEARSPFPPP